MKVPSNIISIALIGAGVAGFAATSRPLLGNKDIDVPLNVLGINRSPYGEVFAMAMQGPIGSYWHAVETGGAAHSCGDGENCEHAHPNGENNPPVSGDLSLNDRLRHFIEGLGEGLEERTNPNAASAAHKFYLRRGIEDKLRFAYDLDPSHYGNYNAYHFFLTEPQLGTRPELTPHAANLAQDTIDYCLSKRTDPRQALTAAAAAGNVIQLMFLDRQVNPHSSRYGVEQMRDVLQVMDGAIETFSEISEEWSRNGKWSNLSELRIAEVAERAYFVHKIRETQGKAIELLDLDPFSYGTKDPRGPWRANPTSPSDTFEFNIENKDERGRPFRKERSIRQERSDDLSGKHTASVSN